MRVSARQIALLGGENTLVEISFSTKLNGVAVENLFVLTCLGYSGKEALALDGQKIEKHGQLLTVFGDTSVRKNALLTVVGVDPFKGCGTLVGIPKRGILQIKVIEARDEQLILCVHIIIKHEPFNAVIIIPLAEHAKFRAHKEQLFAGVCHHVSEIGARACKLGGIFACHFVEQGFFAVHHLVVRNGKHVVLVKGIHNGKIHFAVVIGAPQGIFLYVGKGIVHPPHVPFVREAETVVFKSRDLHDGGGFLGNGHHVGVICGKVAVHFLEERNRLKVAVVAVLIGNPFARRFVVIEIEHCRHSIYAKRVDVVFLEPINGVGNEKALYLLAAKVKATRAPPLVLLAVKALVFVKRLSIKFVKTVCILCKVRGDPVKDNADACLVHGIYKRHKILRTAVARRGRVIAADLIPPRAIIGIFADGHQFHVRVPHLLEVGGKVAGGFGIRVIAAVLVSFPRAEVQLVNVEGLGEIIFSVEMLFAIFEPAAVAPSVALDVADQRSGFGRTLHRKAVRVCLENFASAIANAVFVALPHTNAVARQGKLPHATLGDARHRIGILAPSVKIAAHRNRLGIGRPNAKDYALSLKVLTKIFVCQKIGALVKEICRHILRLFRLHLSAIFLFHGLPSSCKNQTTVVYPKCAALSCFFSF